MGVPVCTCCGVLRGRLAVSGGKNPRTGQAGHLDWTQLELSHTPLCFRQHGQDLKELLKIAVIPRTSMMVTQFHPEREVWAPLPESSPAPLRPSASHPGMLCPTLSPIQPCLDLCPWGICLHRRHPFPEVRPLASFMPAYLWVISSIPGPLPGAHYGKSWSWPSGAIFKGQTAIQDGDSCNG